MKRSKHNLSNYKLFTCDMGELVPCGIVEVLPGDTLQHATSALIRTSPLLAPVMHPVNVRIHHWYVPHRLVWDSFEDFITAGPQGTSLPNFPTVTLGAVQIGSLADYLGVPTGFTNLTVSALPFRAYSLIWNEWYRDQDLEAELIVNKTDGPDTTGNTTLQNVDWEKDYFTSSRPWEQKGPTVTVPLGTEATVRTKASATVTGAQPGMTVANAGSGAGLTAGSFLNVGNGSVASAGGTGAVATNTIYPSNLYADLTNASAITVNQLRQALALQRFEEARARYGSRYTEYLCYLGIKSSDARLQRPEYLGGGKQTVQFSEVLSTADTTNAGTGVKVGELKGHGISAMRSNRYRRFIEEHGYVITCMSVKPKTMYMQGLPRHWNRRNKEDFWQREFQHIGQQMVRNKEVYAGAASPDGTFGYQDRYDDYRRIENTISGEFRTSALDYWHLGRVFASEPALNATFVKAVPTKRVFASQATDVLYVMAKHNLVARRLVAREGTSFGF